MRTFLSILSVCSIMRKAFRYRLYPTPSQQTVMADTLEICRWVYNETLAIRRHSWGQDKKSLSLYETNKLLTQWKRTNDFNVFSQVLQEAQQRVDLAFKSFFRRVKNGEKAGYPRFKGKNRYDSFTYTQFGFKLNIETKSLTLSKIGSVKVKLHRPIEGKIKRVAMRRYPTGKWFASFVVECKPVAVQPKDAVVGIDVGLESFATLSTGEKIDNPRFYREEESNLAKAQCRLSKLKDKKGTVEWFKSLKVVRHIHERMSNKRADFIHKASRSVVNRFGVIAFEDLNVKGMQQNNNKGLAKSIADASWGMFINATMNKAEEAGSKVVLINPKLTSQVCSRCGLVTPKKLSERIHRCGCGLEMDRDLNASINILRLGLQSLGLTAVEAQPL